MTQHQSNMNLYGQHLCYHTNEDDGVSGNT